MWDNKLKAITFSIDDGCASDKKVIEIMDKYGIKGTFNLNSGLLNTDLILRNTEGEIIQVVPKVKAYEVRDVYKNHEVAVHTCMHPLLPSLTDEEVVFEVEKDRKALEGLVGYPVVGMAYPCGGINNDARVADVIRQRTKIRYSRTITSTYNFNLQNNLLQFNPTIYWVEDKLFELAEKFLKMKPDTPQLFYIWGHAFELDNGSRISYDKFEDFCRMISGHDDIFYGTNKEVFCDEYIKRSRGR